MGLCLSLFFEFPVTANFHYWNCIVNGGDRVGLVGAYSECRKTTPRIKTPAICRGFAISEEIFLID